ncbi:MAG: septum formation protein Maf [Spirochaetia bacterium]|nr:septum formation protein Maf [Spirochaetia bacterium]
MDTIILASQSKGRRELLENEGFSLIPLPADIDEAIPWVNPEKEIQNLAEKKALACHAQHPEHKEKWIIAADTLVVFQGKPIGKPADIDEARAFLKALSGKMHTVISGVAFLDRTTGRLYSESDISEVHFKTLSNEDIENYLATGEWQGAAGAYRIQHKGGKLVERIHGSFSNVIGLPLSKLFNIMHHAGYPAN